MTLRMYEMVQNGREISSELTHPKTKREALRQFHTLLDPWPLSKPRSEPIPESDPLPTGSIKQSSRVSTWATPTKLWTPAGKRSGISRTAWTTWVPPSPLTRKLARCLDSTNSTPASLTARAQDEWSGTCSLIRFNPSHGSTLCAALTLVAASV